MKTSHHGVAYGILSAVAYTGANVALRELAGRDDIDWAIWVSCVKAVPATIVAWVLIGLRRLRGLPALPPRELVLPLIATGLAMQFCGNVLFQWALSLGGLALTVPLNFATLIMSAAWFGRIYLAEPITPRAAAAMGLLFVSIALLSAGAEDAARSVAERTSTWAVAGAVLAASISGVAYGVSGVVVRRVVTRDVSLSATLVWLSTSGVFGLGIVSVWRLGPAELLIASNGQWPTMFAAGTMNAAAFFAVSAALQRIHVTRVNLLNASQTAMCALAGVMLFDEPLTGVLLCGTGLTIAGLSLMDRQDPPVANQPPRRRGEEAKASR